MMCVTKFGATLVGKTSYSTPNTTHFINMSVVKMQRFILLEWYTKYLYNKDSLPKRENLHRKARIIFCKIIIIWGSFKVEEKTHRVCNCFAYFHGWKANGGV